MPATFGFLNLLNSTISLGWVGFLTFLRRTRKVIVTRPWSLPLLSRKADCHVDDISWLEPLPHIDVSNLVWCFLSGLCHVHLLDCLWEPMVLFQLKNPNSESLRLLFYLSRHAVGSTCISPVYSSLPTLAFQFPCTTTMSFLDVWSTLFWRCWRKMPTSLSSCPDVLEFGVSSLGIVKNRCYEYSYA